jgi:hypothetical protein
MIPRSALKVMSFHYGFVDRIYPIELEISHIQLGLLHTWHIPRNRQWGPVKNETLRQKRWF